MASVKASVARQKLDFAIGKNRISLGELSPEEFDALLVETLKEIDLRELRGFKPLKDLLSRTGSIIVGARQNPEEFVGVTSETHLWSTDGEAFDLSTHVVSVSCGVYYQEVVYRRHESGEETTDWKTANAWGSHGGFVHKVNESQLVLRRPNNHTSADQNLFRVEYKYTKIPHKDEMIVSEVRTARLPVGNFRGQFTERYPKIARDLIWSLATLSSRTLDELRSQARGFERTVSILERLSGSVME